MFFNISLPIHRICKIQKLRRGFSSFSQNSTFSLLKDHPCRAFSSTSAWKSLRNFVRIWRCDIACILSLRRMDMQKTYGNKKVQQAYICVSATYVAYICVYNIYICKVHLYIYVCHIETTYLIETTSTRISAILPASLVDVGLIIGRCLNCRPTEMAM